MIIFRPANVHDDLTNKHNYDISSNEAKQLFKLKCQYTHSSNTTRMSILEY